MQSDEVGIKVRALYILRDIRAKKLHFFLLFEQINLIFEKTIREWGFLLQACLASHLRTWSASTVSHILF